MDTFEGILHCQYNHHEESIVKYCPEIGGVFLDKEN